MRLGKIAGVRIRINLFFLLLCGLYMAMGLTTEVLLIIAAVLIHEISHAVMAWFLGVKITEIEILPFGGQAKIEDFTGLEPEFEIYIALAGPVTSLFMAGFFYFLQDYQSSMYLPLFININMFLGLFNLCPALPLDGGRILRAFLSKAVGYKKATRRAAALGKLIALVFCTVGLYQVYFQHSGANYIIIGMLLYWAARREGQLLLYAFMRYLVHKKEELSRQGVLPAQQIISRKDTLIKKILESTRPAYYLVVLVADERDHLIGMYSESELIECYFEKGPGSCVRDC